MKTIIKQRGFTLIEILLVLTIVGFIVGAGFSTFGSYIDNANQSHTKGNLEVTKRAMLDYVLVNRHMPCPDTDGDGLENRATTFQCTANKGTVPYNDIGLGVAITRDEFNNVFGYGVNTDVTSATDIADVTNSASYFGNQGPPMFDLQTPPTSTNSTVAESYTVCKQSATTCNTTPSNVEVSAIPAVIVAFNENGSATTISGCNSGARSTKETENCDADLLLWKGYFQDGIHDDQMVTISGYEIKEQVLDLLNNITLDVSGGTPAPWEAFDYIVNKDFVNTNELNIGDSTRNTYLITGDMTVAGSINLKSENDVLAILGTIDVANTIKGKQGHDVLLVSNEAGGYPPEDYGGDTKAALSDAMSKVSDFEVACYFEDLDNCYHLASDSLVTDMNHGNTGDPVVFP